MNSVVVLGCLLLILMAVLIVTAKPKPKPMTLLPSTAVAEDQNKPSCGCDGGG